MPAEISDELRAIRNKYPVARADPKTWKLIDDLAHTGKAADVAKAEEMAKAATFSKPHLRARHHGAIRARAVRRAYLLVQKRNERLIQGALANASDRISMVLSRAEDKGKISPGKSNGVLDRISDENKEAYKDVNSVFNRLLRVSVNAGLRGAMSVGQRIVDVASSASEADLREGEDDDIALQQVELAEADPFRQTITYTVDSSVFKKLFTGALRQTMAAGLFGDKGISNRVWDLRDSNSIVLRRMVAAGIARGDSAATISRAVRGLLVQPATLRGNARADATPGVGVYRSAYKNALRLTRTESNRAFVMADVVYSEEKEWKLIWMVSTGQRERDECDDLAAQSAANPFTPAEFAAAYPNHPQDLCYATFAVPGIG